MFVYEVIFRISLFDRTLLVELSHRNTGYKPTPGACRI